MTSTLVKDLARKLDGLKPAPNRRRLFEETIQKALTEGPFTENGVSPVFVVVDKATNAPFVIQPLVSLAVFGTEGVADEFAQEQTEAVTVRAALTSPSDAAQLVELRRAAQSLLDVIDNADYGLDVYSLAPNLRTAAKKLAAVLNPSPAAGKETG